MTPRDGYILVTEDRLSAEVASLLWAKVRADHGANAPRLVPNPKAPSREPGFFKPSEALKQAKEKRLPIMGKFYGSPESLQGVAPQVRAASLLSRALDVDVAIFVVDDDRVSGRGDQIRDAARDAPAARVAAGVAKPEIEAWLIAQATPAEREAMRDALGFDPSQRPERMTSTSGPRVRDAKSILTTYVDEGRARAALEAQPTETLRASGGPSGLADFLDALGACT